MAGKWLRSELRRHAPNNKGARKRPFDDEGWLFELDGFRAIAETDGRGVPGPREEQTSSEGGTAKDSLAATRLANPKRGDFLDKTVLFG